MLHTHPPRFLLAVMLLCAALAGTEKSALAAAKDDATQGAYSGGWNDPGNGDGFGDWKFQQTPGGNDSYAGHFLADTGANPETASIAPGGKAFGLFANGPGFEASAAFRPLSTPLQPGESFTFQMTNPVIEQKGATDAPGQGSIGLTLRNGNASDSHEDYNRAARFEIINLKGEANYQVYDGESTHDTGVAYSDKGITVIVTLTDANTYDLEITRLADNKTTRLSGRRLGGSGTIESFCIFNRNGEKADGFFNNFKVAPKDK